MPLVEELRHPGRENTICKKGSNTYFKGGQYCEWEKNIYIKVIKHGGPEIQVDVMPW